MSKQFLIHMCHLFILQGEQGNLSNEFKKILKNKTMTEY